MDSTNATKDSIVQEISFQDYTSRSTPWSTRGIPYTPSEVVSVHEIAFAPKGDHGSNVSMWFDETPVSLEQSQIKRSRRMKQKHKTDVTSGHSRPNGNGALIARMSPADFPSTRPSIDPFVTMVPTMDDAMSIGVIDAIIEHRIDCLCNFSSSTEILNRKMKLQEVFTRILQVHKPWVWPKRKGMERVNATTKAPPGNAIHYNPSKVPLKRMYDVGTIWERFADDLNEDGVLPATDSTCQRKRLPIFGSVEKRRDTARLPRLSSVETGVESKGYATWKELLIGKPRGKWTTARELYLAKAGPVPARNMPLSTIPFVQS